MSDILNVFFWHCSLKITGSWMSKFTRFLTTVYDSHAKSQIKTYSLHPRHHQWYFKINFDYIISGFSSVQFIHSVTSNSVTPCRIQHARPPCPSPTPGACSNSCLSHQWCHLTISSSVTPFSSHLQSFPASRCFQMSLCFTSGGQSIGVSASASVLSMNIQDWFPLGWTGWISLQSKGFSRVFSNTIVQKQSILWHSFCYSPTLISVHDYWKTTALTKMDFVDKVMSLLFNTLSRFVIAFLARSKYF